MCSAHQQCATHHHRHSTITSDYACVSVRARESVCVRSSEREGGCVCAGGFSGSSINRLMQYYIVATMEEKKHVTMCHGFLLF